jgi:hypothetical protein
VLAGRLSGVWPLLLLYSPYLRRLTEAQSDPGAPDGLAHFVTRTAVQMGAPCCAGRAGCGVAEAAVDSRRRQARQADRLRAFLGAKFRKHEDARMVMSPADALRGALVRDLATAGAGRNSSCSSIPTSRPGR